MKSLRPASAAVLIGVMVAATVFVAPTAQASHCGSGQFSVSGSFTDKTTGKPLTVAATVTFARWTGGQSQLVGQTQTKLPSSTYQVCLPASGDQYVLQFTAPGYVRYQNPDFDQLIDPVPASGAHIVVNESQALATDLYQSELFYFREDGLYRVYDPRPNGSLPGPKIAGNNWPQTGAWQFSSHEGNCPWVAGILRSTFAYGPDGTMTLIGDLISYHASGFSSQQLDPVGIEPGWDLGTSYPGEFDRLLLYRNDGTFQVRELTRDMGCSAQLTATPVTSGVWTSGWTSITPIDLNGDGRDELLFYRKSDGLFRYYSVKANGSISSPILAGDGYTTGWDTITAVDLDGDGQDEIFFYRQDGLFRFYNIMSNGSIGSPMVAGNNYTQGWDAIARYESCRVGNDWECPFVG